MCKIWDWTKFHARRNKKDKIGISIGLGVLFIWIHSLHLFICRFVILLSLHIFVQPRILHEHKSLFHLCIHFLVEFSMQFLVVFFWVECGSTLRGVKHWNCSHEECFRAQYQPIRQILCNLCVVPNLVMIITLAGTASQHSCLLRFLSSFNILWSM